MKMIWCGLKKFKNVMYFMENFVLEPLVVGKLSLFPGM